MNLKLFIAFIHILVFGIGFYSIWTRANALKKLKDNSGLPEVFKADNFWGLAALLWIVTGVWRAFGGLEKGTAYYVHNTAFLIKMLLFGLVFVL
ncbi:MAG: putative rane protein, partial [Bacteroidota bacterium]|nr:putative rane protein [Bacteroidota bacterium]